LGEGHGFSYIDFGEGHGFSYMYFGEGHGFSYIGFWESPVFSHIFLYKIKYIQQFKIWGGSQFFIYTSMGKTPAPGGT
jgi:hypothetical protein